MDDIWIRVLERPKLHDPVLIEGLPGIGFVGKLAAEHLIHQLPVVKFAEIYSKDFPPQALVDETGVARAANNELYAYQGPRSKTDLIILIGDYQGLTPPGQYEFSDRVIAFCKELGVKRVFTLGGYGIGRVVSTPRVFGAATDPEFLPIAEKFNVAFSRGEPGTGIGGAAGLLLAMGKLHGMTGLALMGQTPGFFADARAAKAVLDVLVQLLGIEVDTSELEARGGEAVERLHGPEGLPPPPSPPSREDLSYIG